MTSNKLMEAQIEAIRLQELAKQQLAKAKKEQQLEEQNLKEQEKSLKDEEQSKIQRWNDFVCAEQVLKETDMKFFRDGQPKYFRKLTTKAWSKSEVEFTNTEIKFYPPASLSENWINLKTRGAKDMFRVMVEGGEINVINPGTGETISVTYPARVYDKISNTLKRVDEKTYNMLELCDKLNPNYSHDETPECPPVIKALMLALSGNEVGNIAKLENLNWIEKWLYGAVHADIGNNMASFPVIYGGGKVGKNAAFDILVRQCLGKEACFSGTWDLFHGNFDGYKIGKVLMFIDEVPEKGSWDTLKNMTGSTDSFVKQKYGAEFVIDNTVRYVIGTNEEVYPLPVEDGPQMMRVSPIKTHKNSTFAGNTVIILDSINGKDYCRTLLQESDETLDVDTMTDFEVGDSLLRSVLQSEWATKEAAQQFINYLDYTYKSVTGNYSLPPLRGTDWQEIIKDKKPSINQVVDYVIEQDIQTITVQELYEIYKVIQQERSEMVRKINNFGQIISDSLVQNGFTRHNRAYINGGIRATVYTKTNDERFINYTQDVDRFITEVTMGSLYNAPKQKTLKYVDHTLKDKMNKFSPKMMIK